MFKPFFIFVGSRYTRANRKNYFISFTSLISIFSIGLGVTVLITVLSVMNGFSKEIRAQMLSVTPHITLKGFDVRLNDWKPILRKLLDFPQVVGAAPYISGHGMLIDKGRVQPVMVIGVDPNNTYGVYPLEHSVIDGSLQKLQSDLFGVVIGTDLAGMLGVWVGDKITLIVPEMTVTPAGVIPRLKRFTVLGIFKSGTYYDNRHAFVHLEDAGRLFCVKTDISGIQLRVKDELETPRVALELSELLDFKYWISDWTSEYANFFKAIKMEKTVMWCILLLIIAVAAFNLISSLVMIVTDKRSDIAIMRTMGASRYHIMGIFVIQGSIIGFFGTLLGLIFGLLLAYNVTDIVIAIQNFFQIQLISNDVYFIGFVPSDIHVLDVGIICLFSLLMSFFATIYPALYASNIQLAESMRYV